jgi:hypothetical protein
MFKGFEYKFKGSELKFKAYEHNFQHGKDTILLCGLTILVDHFLSYL